VNAHVHETTIRLQHVDAAGVAFVARFFELAHAAYEDLLDALGQSLPADLARAAVILPIVHAASDHQALLRLGDRLRIEVSVQAVTSRTFTLGYRFVKSDGTQAASLTTVHVAVDPATAKATRLPEALARALQGL
jgi:YbgC/YbaW family acyl-CoA thioester hydrolase